MAVDKLVDSTQLDSDLTSVANAIRAKSGGSSQLAFPAGFVSEIGNIPSGGGDTLGDYLAGNLGDYSNDSLTTIPGYAFYRCSGGMEDMRFPNATSIGTAAFQMCATLKTFFAPKASVGSNAFNGCGALETCVCQSSASAGNTSTFQKTGNSTALKTVDFTKKTNHGLTGRMFESNSVFDTLILRGEELYPLTYTTAFTGTPFASGGSGGTIYIPKALYDHLGDGTALDYKAATNWSTINGYGTITWAKIEGSIYENAYADGTPIT